MRCWRCCLAKTRRALCQVAALLLAAACLLDAGCASASRSSSASPSPGEQGDGRAEVLYSPPAEDDEVALPQGAPILEEYRVATPPAPAPTRQQVEQLVSLGPAFGLNHVRLKPAKGASGELLGYTIESISQEASAWLEGRLQVGDRITHVNGVRLVTPDDYMQAWTSSAGLEELRVDFVRDGEQDYSSWPVVNPSPPR